jgi:hypothetical protein
MDANHQLKAVFTSNQTPIENYILTILKPEGLGSTTPSVANYTYTTKTTVTVLANPATGWQLSHWLLDGSNIGNINPYIVNMNVNHKLKAVFTQQIIKKYTLIIQIKGTGTTTPPAGTISYEDGADALVTATPTSGWKLDHWELDSSNVGGTNPYQLKMSANHQLTAVFVLTESPSSGIPSYPYESIIIAIMICILFKHTLNDNGKVVYPRR